MADQVLVACNDYLKHPDCSIVQAKALWLHALIYFASIKDDNKASALIESALQSLSP